MTASRDAPIRRRPDGSIDAEFYHARGRTCRAVAFTGWATKFLRRLAGLAALPRRKPGAAR